MELNVKMYIKCLAEFLIPDKVSISSCHYFVIGTLRNRCQLMVQPSNKPISKYWLPNNVSGIKGQGTGSKSYCGTMLIGSLEPDCVESLEMMVHKEAPMWEELAVLSASDIAGMFVRQTKQVGRFVIMFAIWRQEPSFGCCFYLQDPAESLTHGR